MRRWLMIALLVAVSAGCADINYGVQRALVGVDCRPEALQNGSCVSTAKVVQK